MGEKWRKLEKSGENGERTSSLGLDAVWLSPAKIFATSSSTSWTVSTIPSSLGGSVSLHGSAPAQCSGNALQQPPARPCTSLGSTSFPSHICSCFVYAQPPWQSFCTWSNAATWGSPGEPCIYVPLSLPLPSSPCAPLPLLSQLLPFRPLPRHASCLLQSRPCPFPSQHRTA